jgi:hypothetical protein
LESAKAGHGVPPARAVAGFEAKQQGGDRGCVLGSNQRVERGSPDANVGILLEDGRQGRDRERIATAIRVQDVAA